MNFIDALNLPSSCLQKRKIPLKKLYEQCTLVQKKLIEKTVSTLTLVALINEENSRIKEYSDSKENYQAIFILEISAKTYPLPNDLFQLIHSLFPYPTILVCETEDKIRLSSSLKRINLVNSEKTTLEGTFVSPDLRKSDNLDNYLKQLDYRIVRVLNLKEYYHLISSLVQLSQMIIDYEVYPSLKVSTHELLYMLEQIKEFKSNINAYETLYKRENNLSRRMDIHMMIQEEKKILSDLNKKVMEDLCQI